MNHLLKNIEISFMGIISSIILSYSVIYEYGFIQVLGVSFAELPTTLSDHIRSSLVWILPTIVSLVIGYFYNKVIHQPAFNYMSEEDYIESSNNKIFAWINYNKYALSFIVMLTLLALQNGLDALLRIWGFIIVFFLAWIIAPISRYLEHHTKLSKIEFILLISFLPYALLIFNYGQLKAYDIKDGKMPEFIFQFEDNTTCQGVLARSYEKVYMLWDKQTQKIKFIKADKVILFTPIDANKTNESNITAPLNENNLSIQIKDKNMSIVK